MIKLFVSLYGVIIVAMLLINWGSQSLWQQFDHGKDPQIHQLEQMALALAQSINSDNQHRISQVIDTPVVLLNPSDVMWLPGQQRHLNDGAAIVSYDINNNATAYVLSHSRQQLIKLGPLALPVTDPSMRYSIIAGSYVLLAIIIALWIRPLWRDLRSLQQASQRFSSGQYSAPVAVHSTSIIGSLLTTFNTMTRQISRLIDEQKQLTNAVSHELRTPLARLKFSFAMLEEQQLTQLPAMQEDVSELETLIDEMLHYGRLESEIGSLELSEVNLEQLLTNQVEKLARHQHKTLKLSIAPNLSWLCDGHFIERACQNYITNALRYAKSQVVISAKITNNLLHIDVEDDGIGIEEQDQEQVFKAFTRLDKSRNKQQGGFGLGLAIVSRIVDCHHGQCNVSRSTLGGAKFSLILPNLQPS